MRVAASNSSSRSSSADDGEGETYLTVPEAAAYLRLSKSFLDKARWLGTGPRFHRLGRKIFYSRQDLDDWVRQRRYSSTSEYVD